MKYLILLDRKFPYKSGEAFLENEIEEIAWNFDKVLIYPSDAVYGDEPTRTIKSANVESRLLEKSSLMNRKALYMIRSITKWGQCSSGKTVPQRLVEGYFLAAAAEQAKKIIMDFSSVKLTQDDSIYLYSYWFYINAKVACILKAFFEKEQCHVVTFTRAHRFDIYEENRKFQYLPQRKEILDELDHVYACSDNGAQYLKSHYPEYSEKISASYLGTYDHGIGAITDRGTFRIISCSRVTDVKRVELIADALKILRNSGLLLEWTHIGDGPLYDQLKKETERSLSWMNVNLVGALPNVEVYEHYKTTPEHLFVNVSSSEGLPVSIMEAISFGIPTVATNVGGTSEIVKNGVSGHLLEPDFTPEDLAELIKSYAEMDEEEYRELRHTTRLYWEEYYQAPVNYGKFKNEIISLY